MPRERPIRRVTTIIATAVMTLTVTASLTGCATPASGAGAADPSAIADRARAIDVAPELVYTTAVDGYDLVPMSVGPGAADGMAAFWINSGTGATLTIRTDHGELTAESCAAMPLADAPDGPVMCTEEDDVWHRSAGGVEEYVAVREGVLIRVTGADGARSADLLAAATAAHVPSDAELDLLFSGVREDRADPVERGDLPKNGDGAPVDRVGPSG